MVAPVLPGPQQSRPRTAALLPIQAEMVRVLPAPVASAAVTAARMLQRCVEAALSAARGQQRSRPPEARWAAPAAGRQLAAHLPVAVPPPWLVMQAVDPTRLSEPRREQLRRRGLNSK
jgi:hypothetical protein